MLLAACISSSPLCNVSVYILQAIDSSPALRATLTSELFRIRGEGMRDAGGEGEKRKVII